MAAWKLAPAIAAGDTVVINPATLTSLSLLELGRILNEILPAGVINIVTGRGSVAGQAILEHQDIDKLAFTGSTNVRLYRCSCGGEKNGTSHFRIGG